MPNESQPLSGELMADIGARLARNEPVIQKLPAGGRLHIDRQLPFLAVYRQPPNTADIGTARLLLGEAAYLIAPGEMAYAKESTALLKTIVRTQQQAFGGFLLLELWAAHEDAEMASRPDFTLFAQPQAPKRLLERLEELLLSIEVAGQRATAALAQQPDWAPPGLQPLLTPTELQALNCTLLGLQVRPIYRDPRTGRLFPFELRALHHALVPVLRNTFYIYAHAYTTHHPAHYHELGQQAITAAVQEADRLLAEVSDEFDILLYVTPVNTDAAWTEFQRSGYGCNPTFHYRPRPVDPGLLKRRLYQTPLEHIEDPALAHIFSAKRDELDRQLSLIANRGTERFLYGSLQLYGQVERPLLKLARELLEQLRTSPDDSSEDTIGADELASQAEKELNHYRSIIPELPARVEVRNDIHGVLVSRGHLLISKHLQMPAARAEAILAHEVGTHIVTYYNGYAQPFHQLHAGMANYEPLQEGLGVLAEYLVGGLSRPRLRLLAGRVLAAQCLTEGASFVDTFRELHNHQEFNERIAFNITMRIYRGGGFVKDAVYLRGLAALLDYFKANGDLELLYLGKIALEHIGLVEELRWRNILKPGRLRPRHLDHPQTTVRLERLRTGLSVRELAST